MKISDEDKKLWLSANKDTKPLKNKKDFQQTIENKRQKIYISKQIDLRQFVVKKNPEQIYNDQRRGSFPPNAVIDLHGFSIQDAYDRLVLFIADCYRTNKCQIMVITGCGNSISSIKKEFCFWLENPCIKKHISSYQEAHQKQGGQGAYYITLRKNKNV